MSDAENKPPSTASFSTMRFDLSTKIALMAAVIHACAIDPVDEMQAVARALKIADETDRQIRTAKAARAA